MDSEYFSEDRAEILRCAQDDGVFGIERGRVAATR
jgi:hypothetical protein